MRWGASDKAAGHADTVAATDACLAGLAGITGITGETGLTGGAGIAGGAGGDEVEAEGLVIEGGCAFFLLDVAVVCCDLAEEITGGDGLAGLEDVVGNVTEGIVVNACRRHPLHLGLCLVW